ncbi:MAG: hypothetical protein L0216_06335 [Planctomycetales bacterium]|nr:hypothetical protein [Planctomycetales bacterium]
MRRALWVLAAFLTPLLAWAAAAAAPAPGPDRAGGALAPSAAAASARAPAPPVHVHHEHEEGPHSPHDEPDGCPHRCADCCQAPGHYPIGEPSLAIGPASAPDLGAIGYGRTARPPEISRAPAVPPPRA